MAVLILDTFVGTAGVDINGRTPDTTDVPGSTWTQVLGTYLTHSQAGTPTILETAQAGNGWTDGFFGNNASTSLYTIESGVSDSTIKISKMAASYGSIVFRYVDANNLWFVANNGSNYYLFQVAGVSSGSVTNVASTTGPNDGTLRLVCSGTSIQYGSAALEGSYTASSSGAGQTKVGIMEIFGSGGLFYDYEVDGATSPPPPPSGAHSLFRPANLTVGSGGPFFSNPVT